MKEETTKQPVMKLVSETDDSQNYVAILPFDAHEYDFSMSMLNNGGYRVEHSTEVITKTLLDAIDFMDSNNKILISMSGPFGGINPDTAKLLGFPTCASCLGKLQGLGVDLNKNKIIILTTTK